MCPECAFYLCGEVFLKASCASGSDFGCCGRADRRSKAQACQLFANSSLMHGDAEALFDLAFQINAPPAHNPIGFGVGTRPNHFRQLLLLCRAQQTGWIRRATVELPERPPHCNGGPNPAALPIHAADSAADLRSTPWQNQGLSATSVAPHSHPGTASLPGQSRAGRNVFDA